MSYPPVWGPHDDDATRPQNPPIQIDHTQVLGKPHHRSRQLGMGIGAGAMLLIIVVVFVVTNTLFRRSTQANISPTATVSTTHTQIPATNTPPTSPTPTPCALPAIQDSRKVPTTSGTFHFRLAADIEAWYVPDQETEAQSTDTLPIVLCSLGKSFDQLRSEIGIDASFWHPATSCAAVACWSATGTTAAGNPYTLSITLAHSPQGDTGALLSLVMTTIPANSGRLANANDTYTVEPHATTADFVWASSTSLSPLGSALAAIPASGLTYGTLHLSAVAQNCGNAQPAYSPQPVDVAEAGAVCARTNSARYAKLQISYTSNAIMITSGVIYPTEFW